MSDAPAAVPPGGTTASQTVLVVDDQAPIRFLIGEHLRHAGYRILEASNGREALEQLRAAPVAAILCDLNMPDVDGRTFVQVLRSRPALRALPVIIVSGEGMEEDVIQMMRLGATDYIVKPFTAHTLVSKVRKVVGDPASPTPSP